jgi:outer membrane protein assembly factor BamB
MFVSNGHQPKPAVPFLPPNSAARGFILVNETAYAAAIACGGGASSVIALDTNSGAATSWKAPGEIAGQQGLAFGPDGTVFVGTVGGDLFALDPTTLEVKDRLEAGESPVIFQYRQQALGAVATRSGLVLFDTKSLGGPDHRTPLFKTKSGEGQSFDSTSLASWMDNGARRWIVLPGKTSGIGAIEAWQVKEDQNHTLSLALGWTSHEIPSPSPAMIINGVVFAASNADAPEAGSRRRSPSVIYALDGISGKELWNSGKAITSSAHTGSLSGGASQIYLGADDGTLYAFGAWIEREDAP